MPNNALRDLVVAGPPLVGKGHIAQRLAALHGYRRVIDTGDLVRAELRALGELSPSRDRQGEHATTMITRYGPGHFTDAAMTTGEGPSVVDGPRRQIEIDYLLNNGAVLLFADAPEDIRFGRSEIRGSERDHLSREQFAARDKREYGHTDEVAGLQHYHADPLQRNLRYARAHAHAVIFNDSDLGALHARLTEFIRDMRGGIVGPAASSVGSGTVWGQRVYGDRWTAPLGIRSWRSPISR